eukprot:Gregarina_sp_Poly_1__4984@NODE_263_length_10446_cov_46_796801_g230_i0_p7_GENE_NODE_263_length_10446_cov_46_796801_g230_i0NODE_263_length_10446_cov_46_796801_g230_i0_p7_ORF_typecomplete_len153_score12_85_NODE_263_length_10446_cov_46_796801_g230_i038434301
MTLFNKFGSFVFLSLVTIAAAEPASVISDILSYTDEAFNCYFFGKWDFDPTSWPEFPLVHVGPLILKSEGTGYHIDSSVFKDFSTHLVPGGRDCSTRIVASYTVPQNPHMYQDQIWLAMLNSIKRIGVSRDGVLSIWWGDDEVWNRIQFLRI